MFNLSLGNSPKTDLYNEPSIGTNIFSLPAASNTESKEAPAAIVAAVPPVTAHPILAQYIILAICVA